MPSRRTPEPPRTMEIPVAEKTTAPKKLRVYEVAKRELFPLVDVLPDHPRPGLQGREALLDQRARAVGRLLGRGAAHVGVEPNPLARREMTEELRRLLACLGQLEEDRRRMVLLAYYSGWSREQLAAKFDAPANTIKTWLRRSLMEIRECLGS